MFKRFRSKTNDDGGQAFPPQPQRQPNKLSKPRTNSHLPATSSKQVAKRKSRPEVLPRESNSSEVQHDVFLDAVDKHELRRQAISQIFGGSREDLAGREINYGDDGDAYLDASAADLSASTSTQRASRAYAAASARLNGHTSDSQLSLVTDLRSPSSPSRSPWLHTPASAETLLEKRQTSYRDSPQPPSDRDRIERMSHSNLRESMSAQPPAEESLESKAAKMIRRKSLATPGLATRAPRPGEQFPIQPVTIITESIDTHADTVYIEPCLPSPTSYLSAESYRVGAVSPLARAQTPGDTDYGHLGTIHLGALTITNGKASPELGVRNARHLPPRLSMHDTDRDDDYFTASEGDQTPVIVSPTVETFVEVRERRSFQQQREAWMDARSSSPLKQEFVISKPSIDSFATCKAAPEQQQTLLVAPVLSRSASQLARGYLSELQSSPYEPQIARAVSLKRVTPSRTVSAASVQSISVYSVETAEYIAELRPIDPAVELDTTVSEAHDTVDDSLPDLGDSSMVESSEQEVIEDNSLLVTPPKMERPIQPSKIDSGYSSAASDQIAVTPADERDDPVSTDQDSLDELDLATPKRRLNKAGEILGMKNFDQARHDATMVAQHQWEPSKPRPVSANKPKRLSILRSVSWGRAKAEAEFASTRSVPTIATVRTVESTSTTTSKKQDRPPRTRLLKFRPKARTAVTMPDAHAPGSYDIPRVPTPTKMQHTHRLSLTPQLSHTESTFTPPEDSAVENKDEEVPQQQPLEIRFPTPATEMDDEEYDEMAERKKRRSWRVSMIAAKDNVPDERPPTPPQHRSTIGGFFGRGARSASVDRRARPNLYPEGAVIADLATAAVSLGSSPYDIATVTTRGGNRPSINTNNTSVIHPHQISTSTSRPRSWVEMDDATASEFAKEKSRQRAAIASARLTENGGMIPPPKRRPAGPLRPNSFYEGMATSGSRNSSAGSTASIGRSNSFNEGLTRSRRAVSGASEQDRGRSQGFREWELNRRASRSRSRPRAPIIDGATPPVPPLPVKTIEREEEHEYPNVRMNPEVPDHSIVPAQQSRNGWFQPGLLHHGSRGPGPMPRQQQQQQQQEPADWSASSDAWRQRRMLLSQNLPMQQSRPMTAFTPGQNVHGSAEPTIQAAGSSRPPPPAMFGRPMQTSGVTMGRPPTAPAASNSLAAPAEPPRRRPTPFDRIATSSPTRSPSSTDPMGRPSSSKTVMYASQDRYPARFNLEQGVESTGVRTNPQLRG